MNGDQLEFDLVSPALGLPGVEELTVKAIRLREEAETVIRDARLLARLSYEELVYSDQPITDAEFGELRVLLGKAEFSRHAKLWQARGRRNARRVRKVLFKARSFFNL